MTAALLAAACSSLCFMAPVVVHRTSFRLGGKDRLVWVTHRFAMAGLALLALAMLLSIWIVIAYLFTYLAAHVISGYWPQWWSCCGSLCRCISGRR